MERKLTPREERSRDKWRERGRLAQIQIQNGWSREELAEYFKGQAATNDELINTFPTVLYNSADYVLNYLTPPRRKKKN